MIVRETPTSFIYIAQHDHAHISGQLAAHWQPRYFRGPARRAAVVLAVEQHDRAWIPLDAAPLWNEATQAPHSFLDYPPAPKVAHYQQGINEVIQLEPYAGLLCSLHYTSFPDLAKHEAGRQFLAAETLRQHLLRQELQLTSPAPAADLAFHLQLLRFTDNLSLYVCLNEPGAPKSREHPWYRAGIPNSDFFAFSGQQPVQAAWVSPSHVQVLPFPFTGTFSVALRYRELPKARLATVGLTQCFREAAPQEQVFWLTGA